MRSAVRGRSWWPGLVLGCLGAVLIASGAGKAAATGPADATGPAGAGGADPEGATAQAAANELTRQVANPMASLVSLPIQWNLDGGVGAGGADRTLVNVQPVVPIGCGEGSAVRLISRTIVPFVQVDGEGAGGDVSGVGDVTQSLFLTNATPLSGGWTLGVGPVVRLPTGSDARLTADRWSAGPTAIAVRQAGPWTYGVLGNQLWDAAGGSRRTEVSVAFLQPFVNYTTPTHTTIALNAEIERDWAAGTESAPLHLILNQLLRVGPQPLSAFVGLRYWAAHPSAGPEGLGVRFGATLLFPLRRPPRGRR